MLDAIAISNGIAVTSPYVMSDQIVAITKNTSLKSFAVRERDAIGILEILKSLQPRRDTTSSTIKLWTTRSASTELEKSYWDS